MARLIPSFTDDHTPPGEREVFSLLADGPDDWVALHSLDLAPWNRSLRTEIDFVVIAPDTGILCLEIKSHERIAFDGHRWYPESISRSPFKQAADGRHTFYRRLADIAPQFKNVPIVHGCIFPRAAFDVHLNLSVQPWELIDMRTLRAFSDGNAFCADLRSRMQQSIAADLRLSSLHHRLSNSQVDEIVRCCVPVQKARPQSREEITRREEEVARLLRGQQKPVLQLAALNDRVIVSGGAGTGKTLVAMEVARSAAEKGRRVALLCYNQLIGDWMKQRIEQTSPALPNLVAGRAIRIMAEMIGLRIPESPSLGFWDIDLPRELENRLTDPDLKASAAFDYFVLDEAQDFVARPWLLQCLGQFLSGGLDKGSFALFGDFDHQVLGEREEMLRSLAALDMADRPVRWRLAENCRNYRIVGDTAIRLAGFSDPVYSGYLRSGGSILNYDIFFYEDEQAQVAKLSTWLKEFKEQGYKPSEISLLSFRADQVSAARRLERGGYRLRPEWQPGNVTGYASVHAFKGMENKVVILTDVTLDDEGFRRDLFYTGMTRATESVRVLCEKSSQETLFAWLSGKAEV